MDFQKTHPYEEELGDSRRKNSPYAKGEQETTIICLNFKEKLLHIMIFKMLYILHVIFQILLEVGEIDEEVYDI